MRDYQDIIDAQKSLTTRQDQAAISGLPPGFKIGCKLTRFDGHTVTIGIGIVEVAGRQVEFREAYPITETADFVCAKILGRLLG